MGWPGLKYWVFLLGFRTGGVVECVVRITQEML
jgi:hypothetical protein